MLSEMMAGSLPSARAIEAAQVNNNARRACRRFGISVKPYPTPAVDSTARPPGRYNPPPMNAANPMTRAERALTIVLRVNGAITSLAVCAVFLPLGWMDDVHRALGMGPAPRGPIFEYLARTVSFLYFVHGMLCL